MKKSGLRRAAAALSSIVSTGVLAVLLGPAACSPDVSFGDVACDDGLTECGGACADLNTDAAHCGACGSACEPGASCTAGQCGVFCDGPTVDCGGECVVFETDPQHCGGCFIACPAGSTCQGGACEDTGCAGGLSACGALCVDLSTDPENCGACLNVCADGAPCIAGVCAGSACPPGQVPCGGACVDVGANEQHCGGCFLACEPGESCLGGQCEGGCGPGETSCNGACVDLENDPDHCGTCGTSCQAGEACTSGVCASCPAGICGLCEVQPIGSAVPQTVTGSTAGAPAFFNPSCAPPGAGERAYSFTAPAADTYVFDTLASSYDTVLALLDAGCDPVACNDDANGNKARIEVDLAANETVIVVVDGFAGDEGDFVLHVDVPTVGMCPDADLGSMIPQAVTGSTVGASDDVPASCGAAGGHDRAYLFTAPAASNYVFDTFGSMLDTIVHVHDGACDGPSLGCDDDSMMSFQSMVTVSLAANQTVVVVVDGFGAAQGDFVLHVQDENQ